MKCLSDDSFSFFQEQNFANISPTFSCEVQTRVLKYSEQYIRVHLSGTKLTIWIVSEYNAVFHFSCIALSLTKIYLDTDNKIVALIHH